MRESIRVVVEGPIISAVAHREERDLVQIVYVSAVAPGMSAGEIGAIADRARARSEASRLTGLLLHRDRYFYAVLEGPRRRVLQRVEEIIAERGERGLRIIREEAVAVRRFANWSFGALPGATADGGPDDFLWAFSRLLD
jgi:hypothetical protein